MLNVRNKKVKWNEICFVDRDFLFTQTKIKKKKKKNNKKRYYKQKPLTLLPYSVTSDEFNVRLGADFIPTQPNEQTNFFVVEIFVAEKQHLLCIVARCTIGNHCFILIFFFGFCFSFFTVFFHKKISFHFMWQILPECEWKAEHISLACVMAAI